MRLTILCLSLLVSCGMLLPTSARAQEDVVVMEGCVTPGATPGVLILSRATAVGRWKSGTSMSVVGQASACSIRSSGSATSTRPRHGRTTSCSRSTDVPPDLSSTRI